MEEQLPASQNRVRLQIQSCLGRTPLGDAYRAQLWLPGSAPTTVDALVLDPRVEEGSDASRRLTAESTRLRALRHPVIPRILEVGRVDRQVAIVTDAVESDDLGAVMHAGIPAPALLEAIGEVAAALQFAWTTPGSDGRELRLIHGDIRPGTVRIGHQGEVRVVELGIARALAADKPGSTAGHWLYMAPERFSREDGQPAGDVYSLGCILFEGLCGRHPFDGMTFTELYPFMLDARKAGAWLDKQLGTLPDGTSQAVADLLRRMLALDPARRPSAADIAREHPRAGALGRWCRERAWPPPVSVAAPLVGRVVVLNQQDGLRGGRIPDSGPRQPLPSNAPPYMPTPVPPRRAHEPAPLDPLEAPLAKSAPLPPRLPQIALPASVPPVARAHAPPVPVSPPGIAPRIHTPRPSPAPEPELQAGGWGAPAQERAEPTVVMPLDVQLTSSWQRTLTPAPARGRSWGPQSGGDDGPDLDPLDLGDLSLQPERSRLASMLVIAASVATVTLVLVLALAFVLNRPPPLAPEGPRLSEVITPQGDRVSAVTASVPVAAPDPIPVAAVPVAAPVVAAPRPPAPAAQPRGGARQLAQRGWDTMEKDPGAAEALFRSALQTAPNEPDVTYGLGYSLLKQGQAQAARPYLCQAAATGDSDTKREVTALVGRNGLSCE